MYCFSVSFDVCNVSLALYVVRCLLLGILRVLCVACCVVFCAFVMWWLSFVVWCMLIEVCVLTFVGLLMLGFAFCLLVVARSWRVVACCVIVCVVVGCWLLFVCCSLLHVCCPLIVSSWSFDVLLLCVVCRCLLVVVCSWLDVVCGLFDAVCCCVCCCVRSL